MKAIILTEPGPPENLVITDLPKPTIGENEILIKVEALSINPVDVKTRKGTGVYGRIKTESPLILGWDVSGVVVEKGSSVAKFNIGDEVFGMVNFPGHGKAYAEFVAGPESHFAHKPKSISHSEASAATLAALTAWQILVESEKVKSGDRVLIHAASGGVGHFAVQIAKHFGAYVIGTSSAKNKDFVLGLGADEHIDYTDKPFESVVSGIDIVFDTFGSDYVERSLAVVNDGARIITIAAGISDLVQEKANERNIKCGFILVRSEGNHQQEIANLLEMGIIKAHLAGEYSFENMAAAHTKLELGRTVGKIVVRV